MPLSTGTAILKGFRILAKSFRASPELTKRLCDAKPRHMGSRAKTSTRLVLFLSCLMTPETAWTQDASPQAQAEALVTSAVAEGYHGQVDAALADYTRALTLNPGLAIAYLNRGDMRFRIKNDAKGALADFNQGLRLSPGSYASFIERARLRLFLGDVDGAIADETAAVQLHPPWPETQAEAYRWRGFAETLKTLRAAVGNDSVHAALADLRKSIDLFSRDQDEAHFFIWIVEAADPAEMQEATADLANYMSERSGDSNDWEAQVGAYLSGNESESELLRACERGNSRDLGGRRSDAAFYIGVKRAYGDDEAGAAMYFQKSLTEGVIHGIITDMATAWLDKIKHAAPPAANPNP